MSRYSGVYCILGADDPFRETVIQELMEAAGASGLDRRLGLPSGEAAPEIGTCWENLGREGSLWVITDGRSDPRDALEELVQAYQKDRFPLNRIILILNLGLLHQQASLRQWYEACLHFSDVALVVNWTHLPAKWVRDWEMDYKRSHNPCLLVKVGKKGLTQPDLILYPEARRLTQIFEEEDAPGEDLDLVLEEGAPDEEEEDGAADPWLERLSGGGRKRHLPGIAKFLSPAEGDG